MEKSDEYKLVKKVQAGDGEAFSELYEAHFEWVYKFLRVKVSDVHIAQELTQDVFMRAYESISQFRVDGSFSAWINGITQRVLLER
jgi:RNA polymerase sigma-70 factor (ECF subfamily)